MSQREQDLPAGREWLYRVILMTVSLLIGLVFVEVGLRIVKPESTNYNHLLTIYRTDPEIGYLYLPDSSDVVERLEYRVEVTTNSAGWRDDPFSVARTPEVTRIAVIGDSFTAGLEVSRPHTYPDVLEAALNEAGAGCPCEVYNFGLDGTGTVQHRQIYERFVREYQPDIVIHGFYRNDIWETQVETIYRQVYRDYVLFYQDEADVPALKAEIDRTLTGIRPALRWAVERSYLVRAVHLVLADRLGWDYAPLHRNTLRGAFTETRSAEEALTLIADESARMAELCEADGCAYIFMAIPSQFEAEGSGSFTADQLIEELDARGVRVLSLLPAFREGLAQGEQLYYRYDAHCTEAGYALLGETVASYLQEEGLLR